MGARLNSSMLQGHFEHREVSDHARTKSLMLEQVPHSPHSSLSVSVYLVAVFSSASEKPQLVAGMASEESRENLFKVFRCL